MTLSWFLIFNKMEFLNFEGEIHFEIDIWAGYLAAALIISLSNISL